MTNLLGSLYHTMFQSGSPDEQASMRQFKDATKFIFNADGLAPALLAPAADFACQLNEFGILRLPYDSVVMKFGPFVDDDPIADALTRVHHYVVTAWTDERAICGRLYVVGSHFSNTSRATYRTVPSVPWGQDRKQYWKQTIQISGIDSSPAGGRTEFHNVMTDAEYFDVGRSMFGGMLFMMLGLLNTDGVIKSEVGSPKWINAKREKNGEPPIFGYHLLKIDPSRVHLPGAVAANGTHASPRLHWRRGHVRRLSSGRLTVVRPCLVGDPSLGKIDKDYVVRGPAERAA